MKTYALVGAAAAIAAAVGPLLGGFVTTYLSWRVGFVLEAVVIAVVLSQIGLVKTSRTRARGSRRRSARSSPSSAWAAWCSASWSGRRAASTSLLLIAIGAVALARSPAGSCGASARASRRCSIRTCSRSRTSRLGITGQMLQNIALGGAMIALPIFLQMKLEYNAMETGLSLAPLSLTHVRRRDPRRDARPAAGAPPHHPHRVRAVHARHAR